MLKSEDHSFLGGAVSPPSQSSSHDNSADADLDAHITSSSPRDQSTPCRLLGTAAMAETNACSAVIVSCPHSGRYYPEELVAAGSIGLNALRDLEDFAVDTLLDDLRHTTITGICNHIARAYIDVNRPDDALDQTMFDKPITAAKQTRKVMAGYGLLPRLTSARDPIHDQPLTIDAANRRIQYAYRPYHDRLQQLIGNASHTHGHYLLVDCHSMPATDQYNRHLPDIILGDCHGRTLAPFIGRQIDDFIRSNNFTVGWNTPYAGGYITKNYGRAATCQQSIQIEINRRLYMTHKYALDQQGSKNIAALLARIGAILSDKLAKA